MDYILHILVMVALFAILATSFNLLIGYAGLFALSHAAFFGIGAYATAIVATKLGLPFPIPLLMGLLRRCQCRKRQVLDPQVTYSPQKGASIFCPRSSPLLSSVYSSGSDRDVV